MKLYNINEYLAHYQHRGPALGPVRSSSKNFSAKDSKLFGNRDKYRQLLAKKLGTPGAAKKFQLSYPMIVVTMEFRGSFGTGEGRPSYGQQIEQFVREYPMLDYQNSINFFKGASSGEALTPYMLMHTAGHAAFNNTWGVIFDNDTGNEPVNQLDANLGINWIQGTAPHANDLFYSLVQSVPEVHQLQNLRQSRIHSVKAQGLDLQLLVLAQLLHFNSGTHVLRSLMSGVDYKPSLSTQSYEELIHDMFGLYLMNGRVLFRPNKYHAELVKIWKDRLAAERMRRANAQSWQSYGNRMQMQTARDDKLPNALRPISLTHEVRQKIAKAEERINQHFDNLCKSLVGKIIYDLDD